MSTAVQPVARPFSRAWIAVVVLAGLCGLHSSVSASSSSSSAPQVSLSVSPTTFVNYATVEVSWSLTGGDFDPINDYVSAWWAPFFATYTEYVNVTSNAGSASFDLLNARAPFFFRYYRGDEILAESAYVYPEASYPMQIHTRFSDSNPDDVVVIWNTNRTTGTEVVYYGIGENLNMTVAASANYTYTHAQLNEFVSAELGYIPIRQTQFANLSSRALRCVWGTCYNDSTSCLLFADPGYFHYAVLTGLQSNTQYSYVVGESGGFMSTTQWFNSRVAPGPNASIQVVYFADAGVGRTAGRYSGSASHNAVPVGDGNEEGARLVWDAVLNDPLHPFDQASIMNGDISYARGWPWIWELFHNQTKDIFGPAPVMATFGNHEFDWAGNPFKLLQGGDSGGEAGIPTAARFALDWNQPWFAIPMGPITFIGLSSEQSVTEQSAWLASVLPQVNRNVTPFLVVFLHRPIHMSSTWIDHDLQSLMETEYTDLFSAYGVDLVLSGHAHYYERLCAINSGDCAGYGYRPVWQRFVNQTLADNSCTKEDSKKWHVSLASCKVTCMWDSSCTGAFIDDDKKCMLVKCQQPFQLVPATHDTYSLTRAAGNPPVYIVDGTAGGVHTPTSSPKSKLTMYKDFNQWGYSRIVANGTALAWTHYHIDGSVVDQLTLAPVNA